MRWSLMPLPLWVVSFRDSMLSYSLHMSSPDLIRITARQSPVIDRLHDSMSLAVAYAAAIRDNAQEEGIQIPAELVASFADDYNAIITALTEAAS
jgi:hypothetical protein